MWADIKLSPNLRLQKQVRRAAVLAAATVEVIKAHCGIGSF